ncbi:MAG: ABC-2 transporter permease [Firmicutes bacterium]|nr:ABC-2 transporter permease [Bacillota bacterium]
MKGLILKDLYTLKGYGKQYFMVFAFMVLWAVFMKTPGFITIYAVMMGSMLVVSTMSVDENTSFDRYVLTMPVNTGTLVKSKYLLLLITTFAGVFVSLIFNLVITLMTITNDRLVMSEDEWAGVLASVTLFLVADAIALPFMFKLGAEKARYLYIGITLAIALLIFGLAKLMQMAGGNLEAIEKIPSLIYCIGFVMVCVAALLVSYRASVKAVKNKEW